VVASGAGPDEAGAVRVMTWNLHGLGPRVGVLDPAALAAAVVVVRAQRPDLLAVTEPPRGVLGRWRLRRFASRAGLRVAVAGRGARTCALLVAPGCTTAARRRLPLPKRVPGTRRGAALAVVDDVAVAVVHLGLDADERDEHTALVLTALAALPGTTTQAPAPALALLAGDLNCPPGSRAWRAAEAAGLRDAAADGPLPTFPAVDPQHRIDAVLVGRAFVVRATFVPDDERIAAASDHRPLVVDLAVAAT
jgi:endonuclease/exonuclease/phosphatase family metal-dependent hydrolase